MLRKLGIPALVLGALMTIVPAASAGVRFGVGIGGPVYAPAYPYYGYYGPYYGYPYVYGGWGWGHGYYRHWHRWR
jgi:hypothetical protein